MNKDKDQPSAGLTFMQAAWTGMPKSLGDRERIAVMDGAMTLAVESRFAFKPDDAQALKRMGIETCVGVFRPVSQGFYSLACRVGGTYPRMWEKACDIRPWMAAVSSHYDRRDYRQEILESNRVTIGNAVLLPPTFSKGDDDLAKHEVLEVWWITDSTDKTLNLCRYKPSAGFNGAFQRPGGAPARLRKLSREQWAEQQALAKAAWQLALDQKLKTGRYTPSPAEACNAEPA